MFVNCTALVIMPVFHLEQICQVCGHHLPDDYNISPEYGIVEFNVPLDTLYTVGHFGDNFTGRVTQPTVS